MVGQTSHSGQLTGGNKMAASLRGQLGVKSSPLCPTASKLTTQYLVLDHMNNHYKKLSNVKPSIDNTPPKSIAKSQKVRDRCQRAQSSRPGSRYSDRPASRNTGRHSQLADSDIYDETYWGNPEDEEETNVMSIMKNVLKKSSHKSSVHRQDNAGLEKTMAWPQSVSAIQHRETGRPPRPVSARSMGSTMSRTGIHTVAGKTSGDVLEKRSHAFTEPDRPFTPRTLKSTRGSRLLEYKYYTPPKKSSSKRDSSDKDALDSQTSPMHHTTPTPKPRKRAPSAKNRLDITQDSENTLMYETLQTRDMSRARPDKTQMVPPLDISVDKDHMSWLQEQATKAQIRVSARSSQGGKEGGVGQRSPRDLRRSGEQNRGFGSGRSWAQERLSSEEEELRYVEFVRAVTQDVLDRGIFTNRVLLHAFETHIEKNKHHLDELREDLGIPSAREADMDYENVGHSSRRSSGYRRGELNHENTLTPQYKPRAYNSLSLDKTGTYNPQSTEIQNSLSMGKTGDYSIHGLENTGIGNSLSMDKTGDYNRHGLENTGMHNSLSMDKTGDYNRRALENTGMHNSLSMDKTGDYNRHRLENTGMHNSLSMDKTGDYNRDGLENTGMHNSLSMDKTGDYNRDGLENTGMHNSLSETGDYNPQGSEGTEMYNSLTMQKSLAYNTKGLEKTGTTTWLSEDEGTLRTTQLGETTEDEYLMTLTGGMQTKEPSYTATLENDRDELSVSQALKTYQLTIQQQDSLENPLAGDYTNNSGLSQESQLDRVESRAASEVSGRSEQETPRSKRRQKRQQSQVSNGFIESAFQLGDDDKQSVMSLSRDNVGSQDRVSSPSSQISRNSLRNTRPHLRGEEQKTGASRFIHGSAVGNMKFSNSVSNGMGKDNKSGDLGGSSHGHESPGENDDESNVDRYKDHGFQSATRSDRESEAGDTMSHEGEPVDNIGKGSFVYHNGTRDDSDTAENIAPYSASAKRSSNARQHHRLKDKESNAEPPDGEDTNVDDYEDDYEEDMADADDENATTLTHRSSDDDF
ncbi:uncharacterized protein LOC135466856 isoform X2 [Liolophura sinensis]|uniref:uncharacterized protein LOC135466856 isoform X2 n=1 Tax=Liolophura sinensis TaxID=3198878 RepID=UPI0031582D5E